MKRKTITQRIKDHLQRVYGLPEDTYSDPTDHIRIGWFEAGYRAGFEAARKRATKSEALKP